MGPDPAYWATEGGKAIGTPVSFLKVPYQDLPGRGRNWERMADHMGTLQGGSTCHQGGGNMIRGGSDHQELQPLVHSLEKAHMECL